MTARIGLLFDMHVTNGKRRDYDGVPRAERGIDVLNDRDVDWTLAGGDLRTLASNDPDRVEWRDWHGDPADEYYGSDYEVARALLDDRLDSPYRAIRGNHDRPLSVWEEHFPPAEHPRWGHWRADGVRYVLLDTNPHAGYHHLTQTQNYVSAPQLSMLDRLFDADGEVPTFVFSHAPLTKHHDLGGEWETGRTAAYRFVLNYPAVQRRLARGETVLANAGHYSQDHGREARVEHGVTYVMARHFGKSDPAYAGDVRWLDVDPDAGEAVVRYHDLSTGDEGVITRVEWDA